MAAHKHSIKRRRLIDPGWGVINHHPVGGPACPQAWKVQKRAKISKYIKGQLRSSKKDSSSVLVFTISTFRTLSGAGLGRQSRRDRRQPACLGEAVSSEGAPANRQSPPVVRIKFNRRSRSRSGRHRIMPFEPRHHVPIAQNMLLLLAEVPGRPAAHSSVQRSCLDRRVGRCRCLTNLGLCRRATLDDNAR
jgi:hypothetical protein